MYRLARLLGKTVFEIKSTMSYTELVGWVKYLAKEPTNSIEAQVALVAQVVANSVGSKSKFEDMFFTNYKVVRKEETSIFANESQIKSIFGFISKK